MLLIGLLIGGVVLGVLLVDEGEVVTLYTQDSEGERYETQLWVVDREGELYVRAHFSRAHWLARIRNHPEVEVRRGESRQTLRATPVEDPELKRAVNRAMAEKYGLADRLASAVWDPKWSVPVHLQRDSAPVERR
jgi:hypothetical protein